MLPAAEDVENTRGGSFGALQSLRWTSMTPWPGVKYRSTPGRVNDALSGVKYRSPLGDVNVTLSGVK